MKKKHFPKSLKRWLPIIALVSLVIIVLMVWRNISWSAQPQPTSSLPVSSDTPHRSSQAKLTLEAAKSLTPTPRKTSIPLIRLGEATFMMGEELTHALEACDQSGVKCEVDWFTDEQPVHTVRLASFYIDQYEVSNAQYDLCVHDGTCRTPTQMNSATRSEYYTDPAYADYPVIYVTWKSANNFCTWRGARLPTEAEWEAAARGSLRQALYPWGNESPLCQMEQLNGAHFSGMGCKTNDTAPVGSYPPNGLGINDMAGNVQEWVSDWYNAFYYVSLLPEVLNPPGPLSGSLRGIRGGAWDSPAYMLRVAARQGFDPESSAANIGFRCVKDANNR